MSGKCKSRVLIRKSGKCKSRLQIRKIESACNELKRKIIAKKKKEIRKKLKGHKQQMEDKTQYSLNKQAEHPASQTSFYISNDAPDFLLLL